MKASPLRYFLVIGVHPSHNLAVLAGVTALGLWTVAMSPGELDSALGMLLFAQMFLASTGFLGRARRGHFDPILTSASGRTRVIVAHWVSSALPGLVAWMVVTGTAGAFGSSVFASALIGRRLVALLIVSSIAWTLGFALTRGAAGALWAAGLVAALLHRSDLLGSGSPVSALLVLRHAAAVVVCPFLLLGAHAPLAPGSIATGACAAAVCVLSVCQSIDRVDVYLRDRA